jgi:1,4-dihydroxy-2-naphthoyl-CoA hydrolase
MSSIWHTPPNIDVINNSINKGTICDQLGIVVTEVGDDFIKGTMPADARTFQPFGVVHGGANVVLAESLGSIAGAHIIDLSQAKCLGQEVSATHLRPVSSGLVTGIAKPIHIGRRSQVWEIRLQDDQGKLTCISKLTLAVLPV